MSHMIDWRSRQDPGFTLLEVMVAAALLSVVTAGAMAAFIAQSRATNTQQQTIQANDQAREAIRLISNDVRSAAAGMTPAAGGIGTCAPGTIPIDIGGTALACLPPVFRSSSPIPPVLPAGTYANAGTSLTALSTPACQNTTQSQVHPGYELTFPNAVVEPATGIQFCPDDLVVVAVDDTNPLFMVQSAPGFASTGNANPVSFAGTNTPARVPPPVNSAFNAGYGFDDSLPNSFLPNAIPANCTGGLASVLCEPLMLYGGPSGAVLMNTRVPAAAPSPPLAYLPPTSIPTCASASCSSNYYGLIPTTPGLDLLHNNVTFGSVALPAHIYQYSVQPVDAQDQPGCGAVTDPCVSANLIRAQVMPQPVTGVTTLGLQVLSSTILIHGVIDMQVEFGLADNTPGALGQLQYVNSNGFQSAPWAYPYLSTTVPTASNSIVLDNCLGAAADPHVWNGVCFPTSGGKSFNGLSLLRTVRLSLTVRSGGPTNARSASASLTSTAISGVYVLQAPVQDIASGLYVGNAEAQHWKHGTGTTQYSYPTVDGADYRQVSTEIYVRNLGWTNNL